MAPKKKAAPRDVYQEVTDTITALVASGQPLPWTRPWKTGLNGGPISVDGRPYQGTNSWLLGLTAQAKKWTPVFGTYEAIKKHGGQVRKGEKGSIAIFWKFFEVEDKVTGVKKTIPMLRSFKVFSIDQADFAADAKPCPGLRKHLAAMSPQEVPTPDEATGEWLTALNEYLSTGPSLGHGGDRAYYSPALDSIQMPNRNQFISPVHYAATLAHESAHSTGHQDRLNRSTLADAGRFGDENYSREELVAEMTTAMLAGRFNAPLAIEHPAAYIASWLKSLKEDPKAIVVASGQAEKAVALILGEVAQEGETTEDTNGEAA